MRIPRTAPARLWHKTLHLRRKFVSKSNGRVPEWMRFTILDRYVLRKFLGTFFFALALLLLIVIAFDLNEKFDSFMKAPVSETLTGYFLNFIPYFANQFAPLFTFIAVIFFTTKMADNSEIIAMFSTGMSFRRLLRPYMVGAVVIAALTFVLAAYVIPPANIKRIAYTNKYVKNKRVDYGANVMLMVAPGEIAYIGRYDNISKRGVAFRLESFDSLNRLTSRMTAETVTWDTMYTWRVQDYVIRDFKDEREFIRQGAVMDTVIPFEPRDFLISANDHETLTTPQLSLYIERQRERGVGNIQSFEIEYHRRFAMLGAAFILTVIGMSLSVKKVKSGMGVNIGIGLVLAFTYILFTTITQTFARNDLTSPLVAMWIPNLVYLIIAVVLYRRASH